MTSRLVVDASLIIKDKGADSMANFMTVLKAEIARGAKREVNKAIAPLRKTNTAQRRDIAALKREVAELKKVLKSGAKPEPKALTTDPVSKGSGTNASTGPRVRVTAKGIRSTRARLGLSADEFASLCGVTGQTVYLWEAEKTKPRAAQVEALAKLRTLGKKEVAKLLEEVKKKDD